MKTTIRKIGNSAGIILPSGILKSLGFNIGQAVTLEEESGCIVISPSEASGSSAQFNAAINYAIDKVPNEADIFLRLWREGDWKAIAKEFPDFKSPE